MLHALTVLVTLCVNVIDAGYAPQEVPNGKDRDDDGAQQGPKPVRRLSGPKTVR
jgi:hypothetical protein